MLWLQVELRVELGFARNSRSMHTGTGTEYRRRHTRSTSTMMESEVTYLICAGLADQLSSRIADRAWSDMAINTVSKRQTFMVESSALMYVIYEHR